MATQFFTPTESYRSVSPIDSFAEQQDNSWYRHSAQTGELSSGRSTSPNSSDRQSAAFLDSKRSSLDPRRITPTLHASLVSEILSLRRELESKNGFIDHLETNLQSSRAEFDAVNTRLNDTVRESASDRKHSETAEQHLYRVNEDLLQQRDDALTASQDLRSRLNDLTTKSRRQEQEFEKWQRDWERKNQAWELERRKLQQRVTITENHLRSVVNDIQSVKSARTTQTGQSSTISRDTGFDNDSSHGTPESYRHIRHRRNQSDMSTGSDGFLVHGSPKKIGGMRSASKSLADELNDDENLDADELCSEDEKIFSDGMPEEDHPLKAHKVLGLDTPNAKAHGASSAVQLGGNIFVVDPRQSIAELDASNEVYIDTPQASSTAPMEEPGGYFPHTYIAELPAQRFSTAGSAPITPRSNAKHQYEEMSPQAARLPSETEQVVVPIRPLYKEASTQVETAEPLASTRTHHDQLSIPSIAIHPPSIASSSPRQSVLPPHTVSASTQTDRSRTSSTMDTGMQTETIRIDLRKFRAHLQPGQIADEKYSNDENAHRPTSYQSQMSADTFQSVSVKEIIPSLETKAIRDTVERSLLADSPIFSEPISAQDSKHQSSFWGSQSVGTSSLLMSLQEGPGIKSGQSSMLARELRQSNISDPSSGEQKEVASQASDPQSSAQGYNRKSQDKVDDFETMLPVSKPADPKRDSAGMRTSFRSRASSVDTVASSILSIASQPPPFPVPSRSSSKIHSHIMEEQNETELDGSPVKRRNGVTASPARSSAGLRKPRSSNSVRRNGPSSPPPRRRPGPGRLAPIQSAVYEDDPLQAEMASAADFGDSTVPYATTEEAPPIAAAETPQDAPLVDAMASTMVGEWMWKYTQKRNSFGIADGSNEPLMNGGKDMARQRRWMWLSPYEQTIMWSSKQPTSGSALMGKAGRKLVIKTVLDVSDMNPQPKGATATNCYNRSIVILTSERALKITAPSRERHYLWLMALSFLANPTEGPPRIPRLPTVAASTKPGTSTEVRRKESVLEMSASKAKANANANANTKQPLQPRNFSAPVVSQSYRSQSQFDEYAASGPGYEDSRDHSQENDRPDTAISTVNVPSFRRFRRNSNASVATKHSRRRSNTGPIQLPSLTGIRSITSSILPPQLSAKTSPRLAPSSSRTGTNLSSSSNNTMRSGSMMRMTAFVDRQDQSKPAPSAPLRSPAMPSDGFGLGIDTMENSHLSTNPGPKRSYTGLSASAAGPARSRSPFAANETASLRTVGTDERRNRGYVFDDEGRDPFRGF